MPATPPDFRLYHSNALDVLAGLLANELRQPAPGQSLLTPDIVLIPQVAMRRWLQATLAETHGIAANLEFLTPGEFVHRALDANVPGSDDDLDADGLRWRLYQWLGDPANLRAPALRPLAAYLDGGDPLKPWSLAGELGAVFEKYQAWRRDWLLGWEAGREPADAQAELWRRVTRGRQHRARRISDYLARFGDPAGALPAGLPTRLFAFATLNVSPDVLQVIASQARVGTLHFYMPTPTASYWGDMQTLAERLRNQAADPFAETSGENPLLQAWGAAGRDFVAVLGSYEIVHPAFEIDASADPENRSAAAPLAGSLLRRLQGDLFHRRAQPSGTLRQDVDRRDPSLQVHACHTRLREVQVLHDQLRGLLDDQRFDPPLQPREIAVLAPDIDPYIPYIEATFGGNAAAGEFIPYALADASPLAGEPLAEVFLRLLALPISRFGLNEVLDLLASPPLASAAGLDAPALERLHDWLHAAGARWGLNAAHRQQQQAPHDDAFTWAFALDRLLLGHASGAEDDIAGVAPWPEPEGSALDALDILLRLLRVLARHQRSLGEAMPPERWRERLLGLLDALFPQPPQAVAAQRALERLRQLADEFARSAQKAGFDAALPPEVVRAHFAERLAEADTRAPLLTGGISFGRMVPMRLLPFRVICVLGMNDGDYPRRDPAAGLSRLTAELGTAQRRHGDRSIRDDDRFLFLQLFAAAGEVLYLSYQGADPRDGSAREPSVLIAELLDAAAAYHQDSAAARQALVVHHSLQPFAPEAFGGSGDPRRFSYRQEWHPAADRAGGQRQALPPWSGDTLAPLPAAETLAIDELRRFLRNPAEQFLRQRLDLRLPEEIESRDDTDLLVMPDRGWLLAPLQEAVFAACLSGETASLPARLRARALLPSGPLGQQQLEQLQQALQPYADAVRAWRDGQRPETVPLDLQIDGVRLQGRVSDVYPQGLQRIRFGELNGPAVIRHGLDWLLMCAAGQPTRLVQFHQRDEGYGPFPRAPLPAAAAREALRQLLQLRDYGLRTPLPFGPYSGWIWYEAQARLDAGFKPRANSKTPWQRAQEKWDSETGFSERHGEALRLALRGRDPFADEELGEEFRAIARIVFDALGGAAENGEMENGEMESSA